MISGGCDERLGDKPGSFLRLEIVLQHRHNHSSSSSSSDFDSACLALPPTAITWTHAGRKRIKL